VVVREVPLPLCETVKAVVTVELHTLKNVELGPAKASDMASPPLATGTGVAGLTLIPIELKEKTRRNPLDARAAS